MVAAARLLPLPLVDDWIASFSRRRLVSATLRRHGRAFGTGEIGPLYNDGSLLGLPWRMFKSVLFFPIKKVLRPLLPFLLARDLALAVGRTLALGHVLDRQLALGMFRDEETKQERREQAKRLRAALDGAWSGVDSRVVRAAVTSVWQKVRRREEGAGEAPAELVSFFAELDRRVDRLLAGLPVD